MPARFDGYWAIKSGRLHRRGDELMLTSRIYDHAARLRSFEIVGSELLRARAA